MGALPARLALPLAFGALLAARRPVSPNDPPEILLICPQTPDALDATRTIFREYADGLGIDLAFQDFEQELAALPGEYAGPAGHLLLAYVDGALAGCGAFRPCAEADYANACEMKRLYVRRAFRRFGLGRLLAQALMDNAHQAGYSCMLLDTLDEMESARGLYTSLGFEEIPPYYFNPVPGAHYLKAEL
ncbi:GNAT family N-acetyltransferase [Ideonella azotifigens]|uniref:GNAT family N-acetyltransferase n=1 Tax=Ideonella azotifigens TaxID=513160 RepID=A0ABP3VIF8_9BURK